MECLLKINHETDHSASEVLFLSILGQVWGVRTCSVLLEAELSHERQVEGLDLTLEGFEDLHIPLLVDRHSCARLFNKYWSDDASGRDCSPHRALRRVPGLGDYFIGPGETPEDIFLGVRLSVKIEVGFIWGPKGIKETWCLLFFSSILTAIALFCFLSDTVRVCSVSKPWYHSLALSCESHQTYRGPEMFAPYLQIFFTFNPFSIFWRAEEKRFYLSKTKKIP